MMRHSTTAGLIAAVLLALGLLNPMAAPGKAKGTERPARSVGTGTITLNVKTGELEGNVSGTASHLGRYSMSVEGSGTFAKDGTFSGTGAAVVVAANGDEISGTMTFQTSAFTEEGHTATITITLTEGTGRFADVSGTLTAFNRLTVLSFDGESLVQHSQLTAAGRISY